MKPKLVHLAGFGIRSSIIGILLNRSELVHWYQSSQNNQEKMILISVKNNEI